MKSARFIRRALTTSNTISRLAARNSKGSRIAPITICRSTRKRAANRSSISMRRRSSDLFRTSSSQAPAWIAAVLALICEAYAEDEAPNDKGEMESRIVLRFHPRMAPIKCAVFPLLKNKEPLVAKAKEIVELLRPAHDCLLRRERRDRSAIPPAG